MLNSNIVSAPRKLLKEQSSKEISRFNIDELVYIPIYEKTLVREMFIVSVNKHLKIIHARYACFR